MPVSNWCLGQKKSLSEKCKYTNEQFDKAHCLMIVHSGINTNLSNEAIFDTYDVSMKGMKNQYLFNLQCFKHDGESENVTSLLQPLIRIALSKDTIYDCVNAIMKAYKNSQDSSYTKISNSHYWDVSHDSITKFGMELLGMSIQVTDINIMEPIIAPKCLLQINGGHTAVDLANCLISVIAKDKY